MPTQVIREEPFQRENIVLPMSGNLEKNFSEAIAFLISVMYFYTSFWLQKRLLSEIILNRACPALSGCAHPPPDRFRLPPIGWFFFILTHDLP